MNISLPKRRINVGNEVTLPTTPEQLTSALLGAAKIENWDQVNAIAPCAEGMNAVQMMDLLSPYIHDEDPNIRDGAMTVWSYVNPTDEETRKKHFETALETMQKDSHECAAIWASVTVSRYIDNSNFGEQAKKVLSEFKKRIAQIDEQERRTDWKETRDYIVSMVTKRLPEFGSLI